MSTAPVCSVLGAGPADHVPGRGGLPADGQDSLMHDDLQDHGFAADEGADITIFDPETIASKPREEGHDLPDGSVHVKRDAIGIGYVIVNGDRAAGRRRSTPVPPRPGPSRSPVPGEPRVSVRSLNQTVRLVRRKARAVRQPPLPRCTCHKGEYPLPRSCGSIEEHEQHHRAGCEQDRHCCRESPEQRYGMEEAMPFPRLSDVPCHKALETIGREQRISADSHMTEPPDLWEKRLPPATGPRPAYFESRHLQWPRARWRLGPV